MYYIAWNGEIWSAPFRPCDLSSTSTGGLIDKNGVSVSWNADGYRGENWVNLETWNEWKMRDIEGASMKKESAQVTEEIVNRFLCWRLPASFNPDGGVSFDKKNRDPNTHHWPVGTNLFSADQARQMLAHILSA